MLSFTGSLKVLLAVEPCDLRKSFNGLHGLATERLGEDPRQGALFVFTNRRRQRATFDIPIRHRCHPIQVASFAWPTAAIDSAHRAQRR